MPALAHSIRRRRQRKRRCKAKARRTLWQSALFLALPTFALAAPLLALLALSIWLYGNALSWMPTPQETALSEQSRAAQFHDRQSFALLDSSALTGARRWLRLDELPPSLVAASQLVNDKAYSQPHSGFNPLQTLAQLSSYILGLPVDRDDSLAAQLVRSDMLGAARQSSLDARLLEIVFVSEVKRGLSADDLLEWQLNSQSYGANLTGIESAAQRLLGKPASALTATEAALLTVLAADPTLDPAADKPALRARAADLLRKLPAAESAVESLATLDLRDASQQRDGMAAHFLAYARAQAIHILDRQGLDGRGLLATGGLSITTTLDMTLQQRAAELATALVALDVGTGEIFAFVGDATAAARQPASLLQPFVYMEAFASRAATPATMLYDIPRDYAVNADGTMYRPANADGRERGPLSLRQAMSAGLLPPALQVASQRGLQPALQLANALGLASLDAARPDLRLLAGGGAISALDAAYAYSTLAGLGVTQGLPGAPDRDGRRARNPVAVLRIEDAAGQELWRYDDAANRSVIVEPSLAYLVNDILSDGEARQTTLGQADPPLPARSAAWIRSRSADSRDHWIVVYTPDLALAAHGASLQPAAELGALLEWAHNERDLPARDWRAPADIEEYLVCELSGMLPATTDHCPTRLEIVPAGSVLLADDRWQPVDINSATGQLATADTPDALLTTKAYFMPPDEILDWWRQRGLPLPPTASSAAGELGIAKPVELLAPPDRAFLGASVDIQGKISRPGALGWRLDYGAGINPDSWTTIAQNQRLERDGELQASWATALLSGVHSLRLTVDFADGAQESHTRLLTFDNTPPAITLSADEDRYRAGETVMLTAEARDNLGIERVEFYRGEELLSADKDWRYTHAAALAAAGPAVFRAIVYDRAGNQAAAEWQVSVVNG